MFRKETRSHVKIVVEMREVEIHGGTNTYAIEASIYGIGFNKTIEYKFNIDTKEAALEEYDKMLDKYNIAGE